MIIDLAGATQNGSLAYWSPGSDVTADFVSEYNKANPVPGVQTTPPATRPAANQPQQQPPARPAGTGKP
jgi:hypothetical protein